MAIMACMDEWHESDKCPGIKWRDACEGEEYYGCGQIFDYNDYTTRWLSCDDWSSWDLCSNTSD